MITLPKYTSFNAFTIWEPRYRDKTVLLAARKVGLHNKITFTKAPSMGDQPYYISGVEVKKCKQESNGKIDCYVVPLEKLQALTIDKKDLREVI